MLLSYLVPSRARRDLLGVLWRDELSGSVRELARRAHVSYAAAHRELEGMSAAGLVERERAGKRLLYRARRDHRDASLLRHLTRLDEPAGAVGKVDVRGDNVRAWLRALGAPLGAPPAADASPPAEEVVADALALAHRDSTVARVLPVVLWLQRERLDLDVLAREATRRNERDALGFFLELTGQLGGDKRLRGFAQRLRDRRRTRPRLFFTRSQGAYEQALARRNTPALARRWGFLMNMGVDSFRSLFAKHTALA